MNCCGVHFLFSDHPWGDLVFPTITCLVNNENVNLVLERLVAGYVRYSSATILCTSFGSGAHAFTLDHSTRDFVLTQ
ncbi:hypothetical protein QVD17_27410 [Tagetes erecta]|uniref:Uncharacterized protein n=1 Tax=Tagetes erecta TaxID=13708 RepID=A0AAD8K8M3_TARER|nr:hypothetical protein QVD17_27410 [Tagetes erecta]